MKPISALLYQLTADEARELPEGFQFLEYDTLYNSIRTMQKGIEHVRDDTRFVYLCYKEPPVTFAGRTRKRPPRGYPATPPPRGKAVARQTAKTV